MISSSFSDFCRREGCQTDHSIINACAQIAIQSTDSLYRAMIPVVVDLSSLVRDLCVDAHLLCLLHGESSVTTQRCLQGPIQLSLRRTFDQLPKAGNILAEFCQAYSLDPASCQLYNLDRKVANHDTVGQVPFGSASMHALFMCLKACFKQEICITELLDHPTLLI